MLLSTHVLFDLLLDSSKKFLKAVVNVIPFLAFKGITHANLLKISLKTKKKTHNYIY